MPLMLIDDGGIKVYNSLNFLITSIDYAIVLNDTFNERALSRGTHPSLIALIDLTAISFIIDCNTSLTTHVAVLSIIL